MRGKPLSHKLDSFFVRIFDTLRCIIKGGKERLRSEWHKSSRPRKEGPKILEGTWKDCHSISLQTLLEREVFPISLSLYLILPNEKTLTFSLLFFPFQVSPPQLTVDEFIGTKST